jgi:hypothetical protein
VTVATVSTFDLKGLRGCQENLEKLAAELQHKLIAKALRAAVAVVAARVAATTYGPGRKRISGALLAGQKTFAKVRGNDVVAALIAGRVSNTKPILRLQSAMTKRQRAHATGKGSSPFYWWYLERGTHGRNRISPRPWVGPALDATALQALDAFAGTLARDLDKACAELPPTVSKGV